MHGTAVLLPHSILQRRAYVSCRGCVGIPPSAWGRTHEVKVAPRIKGQTLFVLDRRRFLLSGAFFFYHGKPAVAQLTLKFCTIAGSCHCFSTAGDACPAKLVFWAKLCQMRKRICAYDRHILFTFCMDCMRYKNNLPFLRKCKRQQNDPAVLSAVEDHAASSSSSGFSTASSMTSSVESSASSPGQKRSWRASRIRIRRSLGPASFSRSCCTISG